MCISCWEDHYGEPQIRTPNVLVAAGLIHRVYAHSSVGGNLHIVLDDWNLSNDNIKWCIKRIKNLITHKRRTQKEFDELACAKFLLGISTDERAAALAKYNFYY